MEARLRESLRKAGNREGPEENQMTGTSHFGGAEGGQETAGRDGGGGCGETTEQIPPPSPVNHRGG